MLQRHRHNKQHTDADQQSFKFRLNCSDRITDTNKTTKEWLAIEKLLSRDHQVLLGDLLEKNKRVVVKFGTPEEIDKDYNHAKTLNKIPNIIKYFCQFTCNDSISKLQQQDYLTRPFICDGKGMQLGCLIMPYYSLGNINDIRWTRETFHILKNVLKQVCSSLLYAYEKHNFVHNDLHCMNILIRQTKKKTLNYGTVVLDLDIYYAVIVDFGLSYSSNNLTSLISSFHKLFVTVSQLDKSDIVVNVVNFYAYKDLFKDSSNITPALYKALWKIIDDLYIDDVKSERPKPIDFTTPN